MQNEKGEDWSKFISEMNKLGPTLRENISKEQNGLFQVNGSELEPINTPRIVGKNGELLFSAKAKEEQDESESHNIEKMLKKDKGKYKIPEFNGNAKGIPIHILKRIKKWSPFVTNHKQVIINDWINKEMAILLPKWCIKRIEKLNKIPWYLSFISVKINHIKEPFPWGSDIVAIYVFGKIHISQHFEWSDK
jgi:hypothetical protein